MYLVTHKYVCFANMGNGNRDKGSSQKWRTVIVTFSSCFRQGILERLDAGEIVIGDGGFVFALEKRGYVKAGPWTPEATVEHPEAGQFYWDWMKTHLDK